MMSTLRNVVASLLGISAVPEMRPEVTHDEAVHRIRNEATMTYGAFDRKMRSARKWAHGAEMSGELQKQIAATRDATEAVKRFIETHHDPDDGLLRDMDRRLRKDDDTR